MSFIQLYDDRQADIEAARLRLSDEARGAEKQVFAALDGIRILLGNIITHLQTELSHDDNDHMAFLKAWMKAFPVVRHVIVTDANDIIRLSTRPGIVGQDARSRPYVTGTRSLSDKTELFLSGPTMTMTGEVTVLFASLAIPSPDGLWAGVVAVSLDIGYFNEIVRLIQPSGEGNTAALVTWEGRMLARSPEPERFLGVSVAGGDAYRRHVQSGQAQTDHIVVAATDGVEKMIVARTLQGERLPRLLVFVTRTMEDILAPWRRRMVIQGAVFLALAGVSLALAWLVVRHERDLRQGREELERQARKLAASNAELEQYAYVVSHDLRQPLRMINSYLTLIERRLRPQLDEETRTHIRHALDGAQRMDALIRGLLEYSRIGRTPHPFASVPLVGVLDDSLLHHGPQASEVGAEILVASDLPTVIGDRSALGRLFDNLIGNALKYCRPDRKPRVEIGWRDERDRWVIWVRDNGIGMNSKDFDRAFGIFQRLVTREEYEGTGIGLAVCRKIVQQHGGQIWIESTVGEGSTFLVGFPKTLAGGVAP